MTEIQAFTNLEYIPPIQTNDLEKGILNNVSQLQVGFGDELMRVDERGLWLGAAQFEDAPFSVSMDGDITATGISLSTLTGDLDDIADGSTYKKALQDELTGGARAYDGLNSSGQIIKGFLNTQLSSRSLPNDGVRIDDDGIYGRKNGDTTFYIDDDGDAYFSGDIAASEITGSTITGGTLRTSSSGSRVEITGSDDAINWYNSSNFNTATFDDAGLIFWNAPEDPAVSLSIISGHAVLNADNRLELYGGGGIYAWDDLYIGGDILPTLDVARDIGSSALRFDNGWFDDMDIKDDLDVGGDVEITGDLDVDGPCQFNGDVDIEGELDMRSANGFFILPRMTGSEASALSATNGAMYYRTDDDKVRLYEDGSWTSLN